MDPSVPIEISPTDVSYLMGRPGARDFRIIDCREDDEWEVCRLADAQLVPLSRFGELAARVFTDVGENLIVYCHHGVRSLRAAQWLREHGFSKAQSMRGGIDAWADMVDPDMPRY